MRIRKPMSLVFVYIYLAVSCALLGLGITFSILFICQFFGIDLSRNLWLLAIPVASAVLLNIFFIELYRKLSRR